LNIIKILNYRKLVIIILAFLFVAFSTPQKRKQYKKELPKKSPIYFETHIIPNDSIYTCFISFKIPFNNLLFIRDSGRFKSGVNISYEIFENDKYYSRVFDEKTISISSYETTIDNKYFLEGITSFEIRNGEYKISPSIRLDNTDIEFKSKPLLFSVDSTKINEPIVVSSESVCDSSSFRLANSQNVIPFSAEKYDLLIPIYSDKEFSLNVEVIQNNKTVLKKTILESILLDREIFDCNNKIVISNRSKVNRVKYFRLRNINQKLIEGLAKIKMEYGKRKMDFSMNMFWNEKPKSLFDTDDAIEALNLIGLSRVADSLSKFSDDEAYEALFNYWSKYDEDKTTMFNEVFNEFYSRIDYVNEEFNSLGDNDGLESDRGKIYLIYGEPDKIERNYSEIYNVVEVWTYSQINQKIKFSDKTGTGKFERIK
jgi:GWxTD domain-containing protein